MVNAANTPEIFIPADNDVTYTSPSINGYDVFLDGVSGAGGGLSFFDGTGNTLNAIYVVGDHSGSVFLSPTSSLTVSHGMEIYDNGALAMTADGKGITLDGTTLVEDNSSLNIFATGGSIVMNGNTYVNDNSTLLVPHGLVTPNSPVILNGNLTVGGGQGTIENANANFNSAPLEGRGTVNIEAGGSVDMQTVLAGLHVNVGYASALFLQSPNSAGMIHEADGGTVFAGGAAITAAREVFHQATGVMDLLNKAGAQVSSIQFTPGSHEYASVIDLRTGPGGTAGGVVTGSMEITTNANYPGNLPTTFTH
jgi:hypothetical protein